MRKKGMGKAAAVIAAAMLFSLFSEAGMAAPQMVQAATGITIESQGNKVPTYKAGEKKTWTFTVTNHSGKPINNVTEKQLTAEDPVEVRMEMQLREMVLFRV